MISQMSPQLQFVMSRDATTLFYVNLLQINVYICRQQSLALRSRKHNIKKTDVRYTLWREQNCLNLLAPELFFLILAHLYIKCE